MKNNKLTCIIFCCILFGSACSGNNNETQIKESSNNQPAQVDTTKLKTDMNDLLNSIATGNPDTTKLKNTASDFLTTDATMLSDSAIDKMYGNDPQAKQAAGLLKKWRDKMGITPAQLDSIKKAAASLKQNSPQNP
ncbi:MAG: hypothetical protein WAU24_02760 [Chitinophagaceae bacterium]